MSRLKNAPLIEAIIEIRWEVNISNVNNYQYLAGDLYSEIKEEYPYRESIVPPGIPLEVLLGQPIQRFRANINDYPLVQVGPGIVALNTNDENYFWTDFKDNFKSLLDKLLKKLVNDNIVNINLIYLDFFKFDYENEDIYEYINENLNLEFKQSFLNERGKPNGLNISFSYKLGESNVEVKLISAEREGTLGFVIETRVNGGKIKFESDGIMNSLEEYHTITSKLFKDLIKKDLYSTFS